MLQLVGRQRSGDPRKLLAALVRQLRGREPEQLGPHGAEREGICAGGVQAGVAVGEEARPVGVLGLDLTWPKLVRSGQASTDISWRELLTTF